MKIIRLISFNCTQRETAFRMFFLLKIPSAVSEISVLKYFCSLGRSCSLDTTEKDDRLDCTTVEHNWFLIRANLQNALANSWFEIGKTS